MSNKNPISGMVAKVSSRRTVVLNRGSEHGVQLGDRFRILSSDGEKIKDPETQEIIEEIPYEKARVEVEEIYNRACVARTYETYMTGGNPFSTTQSMTELFGPRREVYKTFEAEITPASDTDKDMTVRVGDLVIQLPGEHS